MRGVTECVRRTFNDKRAKGIFIGAFAAWGFSKDSEEKGHLILDPDTVPIKIQMEDRILHERMSLRGVAKRLNSLGISNPTKDKELKGWKYYNPHAVVSYKIHNKVSGPESEWYIAEHTHEAAFTQEDFDAL